MSSPLKTQHVTGIPENFGFQIVQVDRRIQNLTGAVMIYSMFAALEQAPIIGQSLLIAKNGACHNENMLRK